MVEPTPEVFGFILDELIDMETRNHERVWRMSTKKPTFIKDFGDSVDWFCLAMGMPTAYEEKGIETWRAKRA